MLEQSVGIAVLIIGILGALCIGAFSIPGLVRILKTKDTASVSLAMYIILMCGGFFFVLMSIIAMIGYKEAWIIGITIGNLASFGVALAVIIIKAKNMKNAKHNGMTEKHWCDKLAIEARERKNRKSKQAAEAISPTQGTEK